MEQNIVFFTPLNARYGILEIQRFLLENKINNKLLIYDTKYDKFIIVIVL